MLRVLLIALFGIMSVGFAANNVKILDEKSFDKNTDSGLVLVDFYADWCGPCKKMGPIVDRVADEMQGDVAVYKVNVSKSRSLYNEFKIKGIPTLVLFKDGKEVARMSGSRDKETIKKFITVKGELKN